MSRPRDPARVALIAARIDAGATRVAIAAELGVTHQAITRMVARHGLPRRKPW